MAESQGQEKTEQPTQRRLEQARDKGEAGRSADLTAGLVLLAATGYLWLLGPQMLTQMENSLQFDLRRIFWNDWTISNSQFSITTIFQNGALICLPFVTLLFVIGIASNILQGGFRPTIEPLLFKVDKLHPAKGFGRLFSVKSAVRGAFSIFKVTLICIALWWVFQLQVDEVAGMAGVSMRQTVGKSIDLALRLSLVGAAALVLLGLADLLFQKWQFIRDNRMSRKDLVDEQKEVEGDPHLRARLKQLQREIATRKGLDAVPEATVVIRNPTHFAVALKFERGKQNAPVVISKGQNLIALKIIEIAEENRVPVVENKPLAQTLFHTVEIDTEIPAELYAAVAEVLNFIYGLKRV